MINSTKELASKSLQIKKDDNNFSKTLCNNNNPSFRIYYGGVSGSVPFTWESQPGTPKHHSCFDTSLPPLTPPPSYQSKQNKTPVKKVNSARTSLLQSFLPSSFNKQNHMSPTSPSSLSSSWSSSSSSSGSSMIFRKRRSRASTASFDSMMDSYYYEEEPKSEAPRHSSSTTITCFGFASESSGRGGELRRSCTYSATSMKKTLLNIVGHGSKLRY